MLDSVDGSTDFVIAPPSIAALPVQDSEALFPANRIFCIGRNYAAHAVEMGHDPDREPPFFFFKHASALERLQDNPNRCGYCAAGDSSAV